MASEEEEQFEIEALLADRLKSTEREYFVKWKGYASDEVIALALRLFHNEVQ